MNNGWVKLHRQILDNRMWRYDHNAMMIFMTLVQLADKKTGEWAGGRKQISEYVGLKEMTTYKALKRLEKAEMVTLSSNNRFSVIRICKYKEYQGGGNSSGNNAVTTREQRGNTLTRIENKELRNNYSEDFESTLEEYKKMRTTNGKKMTDKAVELLIGKLDKLYPKNESKQIECMEQSILKGWSGVFELAAEPKVNSRGVMF